MARVLPGKKLSNLVHDPTQILLPLPEQPWARSLVASPPTQASASTAKQSSHGNPHWASDTRER